MELLTSCTDGSEGRFIWLRFHWTLHNAFPFIQLNSPIAHKSENEKSEPEIPWAVIHTDVDGIACWTLFFLRPDSTQTVDCEIKKHTKPKRTRAVAQMKFKESTNIIAFYRMATHLNLFSGLTSWMASKTSFCPFSLKHIRAGLLGFVSTMDEAKSCSQFRSSLHHIWGWLPAWVDFTVSRPTPDAFIEFPTNLKLKEEARYMDQANPPFSFCTCTRLKC